MNGSGVFRTFHARFKRIQNVPYKLGPGAIQRLVSAARRSMAIAVNAKPEGAFL
jgi:hypothetical protein